jgi:hypothetical protein
MLEALVKGAGSISLQARTLPVSYPLYCISVVTHNTWLAVLCILALVAVAFLYSTLRDRLTDKTTMRVAEKNVVVLEGRVIRQPILKWSGLLGDDRKLS